MDAPLVAGATGYVGPAHSGLAGKGLARAMAEVSAAKLAGRFWGRDPGVEIVQGDVL